MVCKKTKKALTWPLKLKNQMDAACAITKHSGPVVALDVVELILSTMPVREMGLAHHKESRCHFLFMPAFCLLGSRRRDALKKPSDWNAPFRKNQWYRERLLCEPVLFRRGFFIPAIQCKGNSDLALFYSQIIEFDRYGPAGAPDRNKPPPRHADCRNSTYS